MEHFPSSFDFLASRRVLSWLLVPVMFLPIGITVLFAFGRVFALLNDTFSASILDGTAFALGVLWCLALVSLLLCAALLLLRDEMEQ